MSRNGTTKRGVFSRRRFLWLGAAGATIAAAAPAPEGPLRARLDLSPANQAARPGAAAVSSFEPAEATVAQLQDAMTAGRFSSASLTQMYLERIEETNTRGPSLHAVIETNPEALAIAAELDRERKEKGPRGPLHGIPILIKDNIDTADRMNTTAGSLALAGPAPPRDSFVAQRLRQAGAVILGKANLSEWANFRSSHSTSGWSARGGQTRNPYALDRNPSGSSSGSGSAAAANLCALAVGTETDGSVTAPSSANSLVGIKPTLGLISRAGIIPIAQSQDTAGPMARTVRDAAILLGALAGVDPNDAATSRAAGKAEKDYTRFLDATGLRGARIGVARKYFGLSERVDKLINAVIEQMKRQGAEIIDPADIPTAGKFGKEEFEVLLFEFKAGLNQYLAGRGPQTPVRSLKEIIDFNELNAAREMAYFGQDTMLKAEAKGPLTSKEYLQALKKCRDFSRTQGIDAVMSKYRLDALVAPTGGPPSPIDLVNGDQGGSSAAGDFTSPAAVAGYPHMTVPAGYVFGLPVGISFVGRAWSEPVLLRIAYACEQATKARKAPQFLLTADLAEAWAGGPPPFLRFGRPGVCCQEPTPPVAGL